jgi:zinc protease
LSTHPAAATPAFRRHSLENGLDILLLPSDLAPVVEVQIWAGVGSADESSAEAGLAHFHEHMLFKGTATRGVGEIAGEVEGAGGRINAFTSYDATCYHATLPSDAWQTGLDVLGDAVLRSRFDPDEIALEIDVVLEEIRRSADAPGHVLAELAARTIYTAHPYRDPILGSAESVASFDRAKVRAFFERWYAPHNLALVAAGDFDPDAMLSRAEAVFGARVGASHRAPERRVRRPEPAQRALRAATLTRPFERVRMELAWPVVALRHPDAPALDLLAFILGSGDSSRLAMRVRVRDGLAERIDAACYTPLDPGAFSIDIETDGERAQSALGAAVREVERLRGEAVSEEDLDKARTNFLAAQHFERESVSGQAGKLGSFLVLAGDPGLEERYLAAISAATPASLLRVAQQYLSADALSVAALLSEDARDALDAASASEAVTQSVESLAALRVAPTRIEDAARQRNAATAPRVPPSARRADAPELFAYFLPGGSRLFVVPRRAVPVVSLRMAMLGGQLAESRETAGLSAFLSGMWLRGTRSHGAADFARASERQAIDLDSFSGRNSIGLTLDAPSARFDAGLELLSQVLLEPAFDSEELERERRETLASIERREDNLAQQAFQLFGEAQYPTHPYGWPLLGSRESVAGFDVEAVAAHHDALVRAGNLVICAAGDLDPDATAARVAARLAELDSRAFALPERGVDAAPTAQLQRELRKDREQAHLVIGFRGVALDDPDRETLELISQLLAGQGGRLFLELRDKQGLAYSVSAGHVDGIGTGTFHTYIGTAPDKLDTARAGLLRELERLLAAAPSDEELARAKRYLIGNHRIDLQRNASHAAHIALDALYGLAPDAYHAAPERIAAVTPQALRRVAARVIRPEASCEAVVRP